MLVNLIYQFGSSGKSHSFSKAFIFCLFVQRNETTANDVISTLPSWWARFYQVQRMTITHIICTEKMLSHQWNFATILIKQQIIKNFSLFTETKQNSPNNHTQEYSILTFLFFSLWICGLNLLSIKLKLLLNIYMVFSSPDLRSPV